MRTACCFIIERNVSSGDLATQLLALVADMTEHETRCRVNRPTELKNEN